MLSLTPTAAALVALVCGAWVAAAAWATLRGLRRSREAVGQGGGIARAGAWLGASRAVPVLVRRDGGVQGSERAAFALGLTEFPAALSDDLGLGSDDAAMLRDAV